MKKIIRYIFGILLMLLGVSIFSVKADYTGFVSNISQYDFDTTGFVKLKQVPRYDVVRLLNYVDCQDCTMPGYGAIDRYSWEWFQAMQSTPGKYFGDIKTRDKVIYNKQDLYYCISYVSDNDYMNGYDKTSPICNGEFCGTNNTSYSEMIQIMSNIVSKKFTGEYIANWSNINKRLSDIKTKNPKVYRSFHIGDLTNISSGARAGKSTKITDSDSFMTYIKYCTYEPSKCGFDEFTHVKAGQWPIADFNFLIKEGILTKKEAENINIYNYPDGQTILGYIYKLNQKSKCSFNNDYDGDGVVNRKDKDPFVDPNYSGNIYTGKIYSGDVIGALQIMPFPMICPLGTKSIIYPYRSGSIDKLSRNINNEYNLDNQMTKVYYDCNSIGMKTFTAKSYYNRNFVGISKANIYVVSKITDTNKYSSNLIADKLVANIGENILFTTYVSGFAISDVDRIDRYMIQENITNQNLTISYSYNTVGKKIVIQDIYLKNGYKLQNAVTVNIIDPNTHIKSICKTSSDCPEYSKFDTLKFGDKVRAILQPQFNNDDYVYTDWRDIKNQ